MLITHFTRWLITTVLLFAPRGTISSETLLIITAYHILSLGMNYMYEVLPDLNWTDCSDFWNVSPFQSAVLMVEDNYVYVMRSICKAKKPSCWKLQEILTESSCVFFTDGRVDHYVNSVFKVETGDSGSCTCWAWYWTPAKIPFGSHITLP